MSQECARCGTTIERDAVRYERHPGEEDTDGSTDRTQTYCSVNCLAGVDHVDEAAAQARLFADAPESRSR